MAPLNAIVTWFLSQFPQLVALLGVILLAILHFVHARDDSRVHQDVKDLKDAALSHETACVERWAQQKSANDKAMTQDGVLSKEITTQGEVLRRIDEETRVQTGDIREIKAHLEHIFRQKSDA